MIPKLSSNSRQLQVALDALIPQYWSFYSVRWARKPPWFPTAKSKLFRVSLRPPVPPDEEEESKYSVANQVQFDVEQYRKTLADDFARCSAINDKWNLQQKLVRERRVQIELEQSLQKAKESLMQRARIDAEKLELAEEIVRREKIASADFITPDKLDAAIEYATQNPVDYNYSLDLDGNKIWGREIPPPPKTEDDKKLRIKQ